MKSDGWSGRSVLITGHTGFKGSWLSLWLSELGARVTGYALAPPTTPNHWDLLHLSVADNRGDIRDFDRVLSVFTQAQPEIVFHLAAQPLVRSSYRDPLETLATNVMGTAHVLEAVRRVQSVRAVVAVTTDKVYANREWSRGYREDDHLGGHDPYSASKAACEVVVDSYRKSFFHGRYAPLVASARAGNVIGGGDWSQDRLIPDLVRAVRQSKPLEIRCPHATRPWQHVLDCLHGYLLLGQELLQGHGECAEAWNFGPDAEDNLTVLEVLTRLRSHWPDLSWLQSREPQPHESGLLYLDNTKSKARLGWKPVWNLEQGLSATAHWYKHHHDSGEIVSRLQLGAYMKAAD